MDDYAGRVLAGRYRLPRPPADEFELVETRAFDTYSGQEVQVRQLLLPEIVHAEVEGDEPGTDGGTHGGDSARRALEAARAAAAVPDHPRLVQVFDVLIEDGGLWVVSELVPTALPVAALLAREPLSPYRAAEIAADLLTGLRALHAYGWAHRNITVDTVLVCEDGRAMLDGLAFGAAQEALCGYDPVPREVLAATGANETGAHGGWGGPETALAFERARQARITVVGPVTERWSPEQALTPMPGNWQLAPPVGPAADLWALGALLFRCVQGHAAFPEESAAELVNLVCAEPTAYAEDCGPLRPVVESLLRQDPEERPEFEQLRGWLRSLVRAAPEPDIGSHTVQVPTAPDPRRLPIVRRKGELVRQRRKREKRQKRERAAADRAAASAIPAPGRGAGTGRRERAVEPVPAGHGRHARASMPASPDPRGRGPRGPRETGSARPKPSSGYAADSAYAAGQATSTATTPRRGPRRLGLLLVGLIFVALAALVAYAMTLAPRHATGSARPLPAQVSSGGTQDAGSPSPSAAPSTPPPTPTTASTLTLPPDFALRHDPAGFTVAVHVGWSRAAGPRSETVFASGGDAFRLIVVRGRDAASTFGTDPVTYETQKEPELSDFRASAWSASSGPKSLTVDNRPAAQGEFSWRDPHSGAELYAFDLVILRSGHYDDLLLIGPSDERPLITSYFAPSEETFRTTR